MYSDEWIAKGYQSTNREELEIDRFISFYYWKDSNDSIVGITINFDYADDFHVQLLYENWCKFVRISGYDIKNDSTKCILSDFFKHHESYELKCFLRENEIEFKGIAFY